ncbi:MAG: hypothetical protein Q7S22_06640 [Candidatus Micrarchaeota archaeon]|nr:hypothetical protein [Candidatus Micrarchaeota archaeon]
MGKEEILEYKKDRKFIYYLELVYVLIALGAVLVIILLFVLNDHVYSISILAILTMISPFFWIVSFLFPRMCKKLNVRLELEKLKYTFVGKFYKKTKNGEEIYAYISYNKFGSPFLNVAIKNPTHVHSDLSNMTSSLNIKDADSKLGFKARSLLANSRFSIEVGSNINLAYPLTSPYLHYLEYESFESLVITLEKVVVSIRNHLVFMKSRA